MNSEILVFLQSYAPITLIEGCVVAVLCFLINLIFKKQPLAVALLLPFILGIIVKIISLLIAGNYIDVTVIGKGGLTGTIAGVITAFINKLKRGKKISDPLYLTIESIVAKLLENKAEALSEKLAQLIKRELNGDCNEKVLIEKIKNEIKIADQSSSISDEDILLSSRLILEACKSILNL